MYSNYGQFIHLVRNYLNVASDAEKRPIIIVIII